MDNFTEDVRVIALVMPRYGVNTVTLEHWLNKVILQFISVNTVYIDAESLQKSHVKRWLDLRGITPIIGDQFVAFCQDSSPKKAVICMYMSRNRLPCFQAGTLAKAAGCSRYFISPF